MGTIIYPYHIFHLEARNLCMTDIFQTDNRKKVFIETAAQLADGMVSCWYEALTHHRKEALPLDPPAV